MQTTIHKNIVWQGDALEIVRSFPKPVREDISYQLDLLLSDETPLHWQLIPAVGQKAKAMWFDYESEQLIYWVLYIDNHIESNEGLGLQKIDHISLRNIYIIHAYSCNSVNDINLPEVKFARSIYKTLLDE